MTLPIIESILLIQSKTEENLCLLLLVCDTFLCFLLDFNFICFLFTWGLVDCCWNWEYAHASISGPKWLHNKASINMYSVFPANLWVFFPLNICISEIQIEYSLPLALLRTSNEVEKCTLMMESYLVLNRVNCF